MVHRSTIQVKIIVFALLETGLIAVSVPAADSMQIAQYLRDIQMGPSTYYSPEAYAYFVSRDSIPPGSVSADRDAAIRSFSSVTKVSRLPAAEAGGAIPIIAALFPRLVHLVQVREAVFGGNEGDFDDCVGTYVTNAKTQFMVSPPILDYNIMSQYENFIDETHEVEFISKRLGASGQITEATFNLKIFITAYIGEGALYRLTGVSLGHDPNAWRQWATGSVPLATRTYEQQYMIPAATGSIVAPPAQAVPLSPSSSRQFIPGRNYRISLTTGNDLEGMVISRDETSVTLLAVGGKPYVIALTLIRSFDPTEPAASGPKTH